MKIAIITCYKQPDYIRAKTLRRAVAAYPKAESMVIKNRHTGWLRYPEICIRLLHMRFSHRPDAYLVTFRGYELLPLVLLMAGKKPVIFDEFVNPLEVVSEHRQLYSGSLTNSLMRLWSMLGQLYYALLKRCAYILSDTPEHATYSATQSSLQASKYIALPVGADEQQVAASSTANRSTSFTVLYYGNMLPLHGLSYVLDAALKLQDRPIEFVLIGGGKKAAHLVSKAIDKGALITYKPWVQFEEIPRLIQAATVSLVGPFGDTLQAQLVITGKTFQSLVYGAPVVIGDTTATKLFTDKKDCLKVSLADGTGLAQAIEWAYAHPKQLQSIAENGKRLYKDKFSQAVIDQKMASLLDSLF